LSLPWAPCDGFDATVEYVLPLIGEGVSRVVINGQEAIQSTLRGLVDEVLANPVAYQWPKKSAS
jgi:phage baseplate assembly protein gpV